MLGNGGSGGAGAGWYAGMAKKNANVQLDLDFSAEEIPWTGSNGKKVSQAGQHLLPTQSRKEILERTAQPEFGNSAGSKRVRVGW